MQDLQFLLQLLSLGVHRMWRAIVLSLLRWTTSHIPTKDYKVASLQTTGTRSRSGQAPNYSECLVQVRTHPSPTCPGVIFRHIYSFIVILYIKCIWDWLCVLTLIIYGTIAQFGADKMVSFARAPARALAGCFDVSGPTDPAASNELKNCPRSRCFLRQQWPYLDILHLASKRDGVWGNWVYDQALGPNTPLDMCATDVFSPDNPSSWEFVHALIGFQLFEEMPPYSLCLGCVKTEHKNSSDPLNTWTDGYAPSPSSVTAAYDCVLLWLWLLLRLCQVLALSREPGAGHQCSASTCGPYYISMQLIPHVKSW